jgi:biopolymer transport protein TolR
MGMGAPRGNSDDELGPISEINVTPLVDVMLVLLIIFMITAPLMMVMLPIQLPKTTAEEVGKPKEPLIVGIDIAKQLFYGEEPVTPEEMSSRLAEVALKEPDRKVYVQADKEVPYGSVVELLSVVGQSGLAHVALMAQPAE